MAFGRYTTNARDPHAYGTCDGGAAASTNAAAVLHVVLLRLPRDFASRAAAMRLDLRGTVPMRQAECECSGRFEAGGRQSSAAIISSALRVRNAVERRHTLQPLRIFCIETEPDATAAATVQRDLRARECATARSGRAEQLCNRSADVELPAACQRKIFAFP